MAGRSENFFHGTVHDIGVGKHVLPASQSGRSNYKPSFGYGGQKSSQTAFATEDENVAWEFATRAEQKRRFSAHAQDRPNPPNDRARVYEVAPAPLMRRGVYHGEHPRHDPALGDTKEWVASKFRTKRAIDVMPGRQGTFPNINWNQFSAIHTYSDANHPTDTEVEFGHGNYHGDPNFGKTETAPPKVSEGQLDMFSGKTAEHHAENDESTLGDYHRDNLLGRL